MVDMPGGPSLLTMRDEELGRIPTSTGAPPNRAASNNPSLTLTRQPTFYTRAERAVWQRIGAKDAPTKPQKVSESVKNIVLLSWINIFFLALPVAWVSHFEGWGHETTFVLCFIAMMPLQKIFDWGGDEIGAYLNDDLRDLLIITLSNAVEATLAIILLHKCELRLLQSTLVGVVLLHLLLIPGTAFFVDGTTAVQQMLQPHHAGLNLSLLMIGVLAMLVPTAFFAALDRGAGIAATDPGLPPPFVPLVNDHVRRDILRMSRGISVILLVIYAVSRFWRHILPLINNPSESSSSRRVRRDNTSPNPRNGGSVPIRADPSRFHAASPDDTNSANPNTQRRSSLTSRSTSFSAMTKSPDFNPDVSEAPAQVETACDAQEEKRPVHPWVCVAILLLAVALMAVTAEFLVQSIDDVRNSSGIQTEWFGLILLPIVSFSADGVLSIWKFVEGKIAKPLVGKLPKPIVEKLPKPILDRLSTRIRQRSGTSTSNRPAPQSGDTPSTSATDDGGGSGGINGDDDPEFAHGRPIDLSVQFTLWWTPFLVLLGWWTNRPMHLLFDYFEVAMLLGACFLVNYILSDSKTNMAEGLTMIAFYAMVATAVWFYPGQPQVAFMLRCPGSVAEAVAEGVDGIRDFAVL